MKKHCMIFCLVVFVMSHAAESRSQWSLAEQIQADSAAYERMAFSPVMEDPPMPPAPAPGDGDAAACPAAAEGAPMVCPQCACTMCECPETAKDCELCPRVNNLNPAWSVYVGGAINLDMLYNSSRPVAPGTPFFLAPQGRFEEDTFDAHARSTTLYLAAKGPQIFEMESGGLVAVALYNDSITVDRYGILPYQAFGDLKNEDWRIAGGLQVDIFAPLLPNVLPFSYMVASGNAGIYRGQLRVERFLHVSSDEQITLTAGLSDPNPTILNNDTLSEDNGLPNLELRAAYGLGELQQEGLIAKRPLEIGVSSVLGQLRTTGVRPLRQVEADVWGLAGDWQMRITEEWGLAGEVFTGEGLGTYGGGILQNVNTATFDEIQASGGWFEVYYYFNPCWHTHWGYGVDNAEDDDLAIGQISRNKTHFANLIWDATKSLRFGFELTLRETEYIVLPENDGYGLHGQMQWKF
jgi:hypothetical protein